MTPSCPKCQRVIPSEDVNVAQDVAFCRACNLASSLSAMLHGLSLEAKLDTGHPPPGAWCRVEGAGFAIGATHRSVGTAAGLLFVTLFWNGIVSVFVLAALSSTLRLFDVPVPEWFPTPKWKGGGLMGKGETIFLWIFLIPFITVGTGMIGALLSTLFGRTEVRINASEGVIVTGIGPLLWRRRFNPTEVKDIMIVDEPSRNRNGGTQLRAVIELQNGRRLKFGSLLREERLKFVAAALRQKILGG